MLISDAFANASYEILKTEISATLSPKSSAVNKVLELCSTIDTMCDTSGKSQFDPLALDHKLGGTTRMLVTPTRAREFRDVCNAVRPSLAKIRCVLDKERYLEDDVRTLQEMLAGVSLYIRSEGF